MRYSPGLTPLALALWAMTTLSACVTTTTGGYAPPPQDAVGHRLNAQLNQLSLMLPGRYGNFQQYHDARSAARGASHPAATDNNLPLLSLTIAAGSDSGDQLDYTVEQRTRGSGGEPRAFRWQLIHAGTAIVLRIVPRDRPGARPCDIPLQAVSGGYAGQSDPRLCSLGNDNGPQLGIRKEIAIQPGAITLADQVVDLNSGETRFASRLEFQRLVEFTGWAGVKDDSGEWRLARPFVLHNDGAETSLVAQDGTPLGIRLQLARVRYRDDQAPILRLAVFRVNNGEVTVDADGAETAPLNAAMVGYTWANRNASQIGLNLEWFQAGLEVDPEQGR